MPSTYKTPGAYVEEITKFPPSVAPVETAIPAFIGYTEFATKNGESLRNVPTKIDSFLEFEQYFGGPPERKVIVRLNGSNQYVRTERVGKTFLLYDSLRLFYDNGGGFCYIVSVGSYTDTPAIGNDTTHILGGLKALEKFDEPTLIVSPDATTLGTDLYKFQQQAIAQCNKLQDRFLIGDLLFSNEKVAGETHDDRVASFRDNIGINFLKYGAAYTPWLRTSIPAGLEFRDITFAGETETSPTAATSLALLSSLTTSPAILQLLFDLSNANKAVDLIKSKILPGGSGSLVDTGLGDLDGQLNKLLKDYMALYNNSGLPNFSDYTTALQAIYAKIIEILRTIASIYGSLPTVETALLSPSASKTVEFKLRGDIDKLKESYKAVLSELATHHVEYGAKSSAIALLVSGAPLTEVLNFAPYANLGAIPKDAKVQVLYRKLAIKKAMLDALKANATANAAAVDVPTTLTVITGAIPVPTDLESKITTLFTAKLAAVGAGTVNTLITTHLTGGANDMEKLIIAIVKKHVEEQVAINNIASGDPAAGLAPFPVEIVPALNQALLEAGQAATNAAAAPSATKATVLASLDFPLAPHKEYSKIAAGVATTSGAGSGKLYSTVLNSALSYESTFDQSLMQSFGIYKTLVSRAGQDLMILPPSGGVAGVYASVDTDRGVWKAPANASLASVLGPHFMISSQEQESLNVDANAGKSINAIRAFTGKGTLVWGTRTLAGNDNEWRYVPVRRYFIYAEESIKKATEPFVFEPNDLNTWVRVKAMIENFLTVEWRRGALAGAKATDAFFVKVGLGETMTALDILEGRMIVEIGLAVVRPAEFIILRFSHKMQES